MPRILVVDDSEDIREMLRDALEDDGHEVTVATNGREALSQVEASSPDVILLDVDIPDMNGIDVLLSLKAKQQTRGISVIMVASHDRDDKVVAALEFGATDFIAKPFSEAVVRARVRNVIRIRSRHKRVEAAANAKAQFLANMSHEIRTPMTAILGFADLLYSEGDISKAPPHRVTAVQTIKRNGEYLLDLINDILDLSKVEAGKLEVERIRCSAVQIVADVVSMMRVRSDAKGVPLEVEYVGAIPETIHTDPTRLRQILINVVSNAVKFTESGSIRVVVRLVRDDRDEPGLRVEVIDSGIGMTEEQIGNVFKPFCQAETYTTRKYGGTGLGLTISKHLAELLGGTIYATGKPSKGSRFSVTVTTGSLVGVRMLHNLTEAALDAQRVEYATPQSLVKLDCRVLLAEDGPDNQRLLSHVLRKAGAEVTVADDGLVAHDFALTALGEGKPYDVILMDMQMPVMDGYEATAKLREAGYTGPIIALTAHAMSTDRNKCLTAGCNDYLTKPIERKRLISMVARYASEEESRATREPNPQSSSAP